MDNRNVIGLAMVGVGGFGVNLAAKISEVSETVLVGCYDVDPSTRTEFARKFGCREYHSYEELLEDKGVDGVVIATPNDQHCELACQAAQRGVHVFVEKPIALTLQEADKMIHTCEENSVVLQVGHNQRKNGEVRKLKKMIDGGEIGKVVMVEANNSHAGGLRLGPDKWRWYESRCPGGPFIQLGVHHVDNLLYLIGRIKRVCALFKRVLIDAEIDDNAQALFEFDCGAIGYIGSSYVTPGQKFINIYGDEGYLICEVAKSGGRAGSVKRVRPDGSQEEVGFEAKDGYIEEIIEFARCIREGSAPEVGGVEGREALAVSLAAFRSSREGRYVEID